MNNLERGVEKGYYDYVKPAVYRDSSLWTGPTNLRDRKKYLVPESEYDLDPANGAVIFQQAQPTTVYIYVTLGNDYLRNTNLCLDCHVTATHKQNGCTVCHQTEKLGTHPHFKDIANKKDDGTVINGNAYTYNDISMRIQETVTNGNLISFTSNTVTYSYNNLNQLLTESPNKAYTYDADGNMTGWYSPDGASHFTALYDAENRLVSVSTDSGPSHSATFSYSADGFIAKQTVDGVETRFVRDGYLCLQERDSFNNVTRAYVWDPTAPAYGARRAGRRRCDDFFCRLIYKSIHI